MSGLTFDTLRAANKARLPQFKNILGDLAHSKPDGSDWSPAQWLQAVVGELGEYANIRKKYERGDLTTVEYRTLAVKELADIQTYLDILALRAFDGRDGSPDPYGCDLGSATIKKFNEISERVGSDIFILEDGGNIYQNKKSPKKCPHNCKDVTSWFGRDVRFGKLILEECHHGYKYSSKEENIKPA